MWTQICLQHPASYCLRFFTNVVGTRARCLEVLGVDTRTCRGAADPELVRCPPQLPCLHEPAVLAANLRIL